MRKCFSGVNIHFIQMLKAADGPFSHLSCHTFPTVALYHCKDLVR